MELSSVECEATSTLSLSAPAHRPPNHVESLQHYLLLTKLSLGNIRRLCPDPLLRGPLDRFDLRSLLHGMLLWIFDWIQRLRHALLFKTELLIENAGNGWYRMRLPGFLGNSATDDSSTEKGSSLLDMGTTQSPLQTFHVQIGAISNLQIHPFTAALTSTSSRAPVLLFRTSPPRKNTGKTEKEWTWRLAALADQHSSLNALTLEARIEGPHCAPVPHLHVADHLIAIVGGTGITGALSLADWWLSQKSPRNGVHGHLRIIWTIRERTMADLAEIHALQAAMKASTEHKASLQIHVSSETGRLDPNEAIEELLSGLEGRAFVYISGPEGLSAGVEDACVRIKRTKARHHVGGPPLELVSYLASFTV